MKPRDWALALLLLGVLPINADAQSQAEFERRLAERDSTIADLKGRLDAVEARVRELSASEQSPPPAPVDPPAAAVSRSEPPKTAESQSSNNPGAAAGENPEEETTRALERTLVSQGGLVLPPWKFELEPRVEYRHRASNELTVAIVEDQGQIAQRIVKRDLLETSLGFRVGLPWGTQFDVVLPYGLERQRTVLAGISDTEDSFSGFGGLGLSVTKQILTDAPGRLGMLGSLSFRGAGTSNGEGELSNSAGFRTLQATLTVVKRRDPVVFFGGLFHSYTFDKAINGNEIDPGDGTGFRLGSVFALSPETSMRMGVDFTRAGRATINGLKIPGSDSSTGMLDLGFSTLLSPRSLLNVQAGFGITRDSPDFRLVVSLPVRF